MKFLIILLLFLKVAIEYAICDWEAIVYEGVNWKEDSSRISDNDYECVNLKDNWYKNPIVSI